MDPHIKEVTDLVHAKIASGAFNFQSILALIQALLGILGPLLGGVTAPTPAAGKAAK